MKNTRPVVLSRSLLVIFLCALALITTLSIATPGAHAQPPTAFPPDANSLTWNTFLGSAASDTGRAIARDGSGNVYVVGISDSTWGTPIRAFSGFQTAYVAKLDTNSTLLWNTFLGGDGVDHGESIALDSGGRVYVAGISTGTWASPLRAFTGSNDDAFAVKLDTNGALAWNTFLGGSMPDNAAGISVDTSGNAYLTGISGFAWGSPVRPFSGTNDDAFAAKLASNGSLTWNTFLGGTQYDYGMGIVTDDSGSLFVMGASGTTWGTPVRAFTGSSNDTFVANLPDNLSCAQKPEEPNFIKPEDSSVLSSSKIKAAPKTPRPKFGCGVFHWTTPGLT